MHAHLIKSGRASVYAATDDEAMQSVLELSQMEGIIPALESAHAISVLSQMNLQEEDTIILCLSGRGDKDLNTFINYLEKKEN